MSDRRFVSPHLLRPSLLPTTSIASEGGRPPPSRSRAGVGTDGSTCQLPFPGSSASIRGSGEFAPLGGRCSVCFPFAKTMFDSCRACHGFQLALPLPPSPALCPAVSAWAHTLQFGRGFSIERPVACSSFWSEGGQSLGLLLELVHGVQSSVLRPVAFGAISLTLSPGSKFREN